VLVAKRAQAAQEIERRDVVAASPCTGSTTIGSDARGFGVRPEQLVDSGMASSTDTP